MEPRNLQHELGTLEEQLEQLAAEVRKKQELQFDPRALDDPSFGDDLLRVRRQLGQVRQTIEENLLWEKSFPLDTVLERLLGFVVDESKDFSFGVSVCWRVHGRIPISVAQVAVPMVISLIRLALLRMSGEDSTKRKKRAKFLTRSISIELEGGNDFFRARILDDSSSSPAELQKHRGEIQKLRAKVGGLQGFCIFHSSEPYGYEAEIKLPLPRTRLGALLVSSNGVQVAIPHISVLGKSLGVGRESVFVAETGIVYTLNRDVEVPVCVLDEEQGVCAIAPEVIECSEKFDFIILGAADFQIALLIDFLPTDVKIRVHEASEIVAAQSWFNSFALFQAAGKVLIEPILSGRALIQFQKQFQVKS